MTIKVIKTEVVNVIIVNLIENHRREAVLNDKPASAGTGNGYKNLLYIFLPIIIRGLVYLLSKYLDLPF